MKYYFFINNNILFYFYLRLGFIFSINDFKRINAKILSHVDFIYKILIFWLIIYKTCLLFFLFLNFFWTNYFL